MHVMRLRENDGKSTAMDMVHNNLVQKLLEVSLAVTMDKIRIFAGTETVDEVIRTLHRQ